MNSLEGAVCGAGFPKSSLCNPTRRYAGSLTEKTGMGMWDKQLEQDDLISRRLVLPPPPTIDEVHEHVQLS